MKLILSLALAIFSTLTFASVESVNCPESFSITYFNITRGPLTKIIKNNEILKAGWDSVKEAQKLELEFTISSRVDSTYCVYTNGQTTAYLQTNNGTDELVIPYGKNLYFRTRVLSFANDYIELAVDEYSKKIFTPIMKIDSNGDVKVSGEVGIGSAEAINIQAF